MDVSGEVERVVSGVKSIEPSEIQSGSTFSHLEERSEIVEDDVELTVVSLVQGPTTGCALPSPTLLTTALIWCALGFCSSLR
jgi:hypothetical protein